MNKAKLEKLSDDELLKKKEGSKMFFGIFIVIIMALNFFIIRDYMKGNEIDMSTFTIMICTIGGALTVYSEFKSIQEELRKRGV